MMYMTVKDMLDYVDEVKQNSFSRKIKLIWLNELEYRVQTDVMLIAAESITYVPDDDTHQLLVPAPWSEIYYDYLLMKLSEHLEESSEQNNRAATFDKAFTRFMRWWADTYRPANGNALFKGYYLKGEDGAFRINVTYSDGVYSADKTFDEIKAAYDAGQQPYVVQTSGASDIVYTLASSYLPSGGAEQGFVSFERYLIFEDTLKTVRLRIFSYTLEDGSNIERQISEFNGAGGGASVELDTTKYGITAADYVAPFTASMYEVAYNNGLGIQKAIDDAKAKGMERITLPAGNYPLCYHAAADEEYNAIIDASGIDFYGYGVKLYVIYDEEGTNPYFTGATPRLLQGTIIKTDRDVCGFHLVGERRFRKDVNTKYRDCSCGIGLTRTVNGNTIKDCLVECVSGDGISNAGYMEQIAGWDPDTFTSIEWDYTTGAYVQSNYKYVSAEHGGDWIDKTRPLLIRCTGYFLYSSAPLIIRCWDSEGAYIGVVQFWQGEYFYLPENTAKWRLELTRVVEHETTATETWSWWMGYGTFSGTKIINCESRLNQRGGMSNLPNDVLVKDCYIHNNGNAGDGMVQYYDTTRFGIDIEDIWIHRITIDGCRIVDNFHCLLFRCGSVVVKNSIITNVRAMNQVVDFHAEQSVFQEDITWIAPTPFGNKTAVGCTFGGKIPDSLLVLDNHALASAELVGGNMVMRNAAGDTICTVDMNKVVPVELASDGLCMHFDFSVTPANPMQPVDLVNGLPIYNDDYTAANYSEDGVELVNGASTNAFKIASLDVTNHYNYAQIPEYATLAEMLRAGTGFTVECFSNQPIPIVLYGYNRGIKISGFDSQITLPYLNSDGVSTSGSSTIVSTFVDDAGNIYNIYNAAGKEAMGLDKCCHMVFTADESGTLKVYLNGFTGTGTVMCADFAGWDYDTILAPLYWMFCDDNKYDAQNPKTVKKLRMYNRALSIDEVRNNYRYELNYTPSVSIAEATSNTFGGVKADPATEADIQPVRIGTDGKLYTAEGGGGEREWVKIGELTTTEDTTETTSIKFTKDVNGDSLSLKGVLVIGKPLFADTNKHTCLMRCNDIPQGGNENYFLNAPILHNNQDFTIYSEFLRVDGVNSVVFTVFNDGNVKQLGGCGSTINTWSPSKMDFLQFPMRGVELIVQDSGLLAGSKFEIWGVKA